MSLVEHCLATLADHIDRVPDLSGVPEHLIAALFALVLERGRLTPRVLAVFQACDCETVLQAIQALDIRDRVPPVVADTPNNWLGWQRKF